MPVTPTPAFTQAARSAVVQVTTANTNRDGSTGSYSTTLAVGSNGSLIDCFVFQAIATTVAGLLRIFQSPDAGTTWRLLAEVSKPAVTPSGTVGAAQVVWTPPAGVPWSVPAGTLFKFNVNDSETWNCWMEAGDL